MIIDDQKGVSMLKYYVADAFADEVFEGNPAGVCILDEWLPIEKMEKIAIENNLSETAFAVKEGDVYGLRWFTPGGEIDLCGHATMGTAYILFRFVEKDAKRIEFHTKKAGYELAVEKKGDLYEMDFPAMEIEECKVEDYMTEALGAEPLEVWKTYRDMVFVLDSEETVKNLEPDLRKIKEFPEGLSAFVTARGKEYDIVARAFWPKINIDEDPVCGAMFCALMPYWKEKAGLDKVVARQLSARGGTVYSEYKGDRVKISGRAALYLEGNICVDE